MKYLIIILISAVLFGCKVPKNSINKDSFPIGTIISDCTDSLFYNVYQSNKKELSMIKIQLDNKKSNSVVLNLALINDTIESTQLIVKINDSLSLVLCFESNGKICPSSEVLSNRYIDSINSEVINYRPIIFNKKGLTYKTIMDSTSRWISSYFRENYHLFINDTLSPYTEKKYSIFFEEYRGMNGTLRFLPFSILYYATHSYKMENWNSYTKKNMDFLITHFFDDEKSIELLLNKYEEEGNWNQFRLCQLLRFIKHPNAEDYKSIQLTFKTDPSFRWIDESLIGD